jgi:hypothetical protein
MGHANHSGVVPCLGGHDWALENIGQLPNMLADALQKAGRQPDTAANGDPINISGRDRIPEGCCGCHVYFDNAVRFGITRCGGIEDSRRPNLPTRKFAEAACN